MDQHSLPNIETFRFEGLTFAHDGYDPTFRNCDFEFPASRILRVNSIEGAGKSTVLQLLAGLLLPQTGSYFINDQSVSEMSFEEFLPYRLRIGFTFDYGGLINNRTIADNLLLPLVYHKLIPPEEAHIRVDEYVDRFDLKKFRNERPAHVPGRVRKLAVLLRATIVLPQMLLLDDPSVGLGESTQALFADLIKEQYEAGHLRHALVASYDDRFMELLPHDTIHIDGGNIYHEPSQDIKRAVSL